MRKPCSPVFSRNRGNVDNAAFAVCFQCRNSGLTGEKNAFDIDVKSQIPRLFVHVFDGGDTHHSSVTHEDV